jgi:subtilisin family serine protease
MQKRAFANQIFSSSKESMKTGRKSVRIQKATIGYEILESRSLLASYAPGEVLIQFEPNADMNQRDLARSLVAADLVEPIQTKTMIASGKGVLERVSLHSNVSVEMAVARLKTIPGVQYAEPNWIYSTSAVSNDTNYLSGQLWGMYSNDSPTAAGPSGTTNQYGSQAEKAWLANHIGSNTVYIGVIDEGIQFTHPDLVDNMWVNPFDPIDGIDNDGNGKVDDSQGWDFFNNDRTVYDGTADDHGTHVAGTIGAKGGNGIGVAGVNWNVKMISAKFLGSNGGSTLGAIQALDYLTDLKVRHGINIVATNNSWGGGGFSQTLLDAITRAANRGILFIAAAGNATANNDSTATYPSNYNTTSGAGYDAVISVASITNTGALSSFSNYGATTVDLGAPGSSIFSTLPSNTYGSYSGTSMATPHVTGAIALYAASNPGRTAAQLRTQLLSNTTATSSLSGRAVTGGRLDIARMFGTTPALPNLSINDVSVVEGNSGSSLASFAVTLSSASTSSVTVNYATANGTATVVSDYNSSSGSLSFAPGETAKTISVVILGDLAVEPNETFFVNLSGASNANISDSSGLGTIINDDAALSISIDDSSAVENLQYMFFTVNLSSAVLSTVTVNYATANGTARGTGNSRDFFHASGTLTFAPGETLKTISISLQNDSLVEGNEFFYMKLSSATGATLSNNQAVGTIIDDESGGAGMLDSRSSREVIDQYAHEIAFWWIEFESERIELVNAGRRIRR